MHKRVGELRVLKLLAVVLIVVGLAIAIGPFGVASAEQSIINKSNGKVTATISSDILRLVSSETPIALITNSDSSAFRRLPVKQVNGATYSYEIPERTTDIYVALAGDVDLNGSVDATDALRIRQPRSALSAIQKAIADINIDGEYADLSYEFSHVPFERIQLLFRILWSHRKDSFEGFITTIILTMSN